MPYKTPDVAAGETSGSFTIPSYMMPLIVGILLSAYGEEFWEIEGDATIEECLDILGDFIAQLEGV